MLSLSPATSKTTGAWTLHRTSCTHIWPRQVSCIASAKRSAEEEARRGVGGGGRTSGASKRIPVCRAHPVVAHADVRAVDQAVELRLALFAVRGLRRLVDRELVRAQVEVVLDLEQLIVRHGHAFFWKAAGGFVSLVEARRRNATNSQPLLAAGSERTAVSSLFGGAHENRIPLHPFPSRPSLEAAAPGSCSQLVPDRERFPQLAGPFLWSCHFLQDVVRAVDDLPRPPILSRRRVCVIRNVIVQNNRPSIYTERLVSPTLSPSLPPSHSCQR